MARYIQPPSGQLMQAMLQAQQQKSQRRQAIGQSIEGVVKKFQDDKIKKQNALNDAMFQKAKITLDFRSKFNINKPGGTPATEEVARVVGVAPGTLISRKEDKVKPVRQHTLTASDQKLINTQEKTMAVDIFKTKFNAANKIEANRIANSTMSIKDKVTLYRNLANDNFDSMWNYEKNTDAHNMRKGQAEIYLKMADDLVPSKYWLEKKDYEEKTKDKWFGFPKSKTFKKVKVEIKEKGAKKKTEVKKVQPIGEVEKPKIPVKTKSKEKEEGYTVMIKDGAEFKVPDANVEKAKLQGYTVK